MPKFATYTLAWSPTRYRYELYAGRTERPLEIVPESSAWFSWVSEVPSFAFRGKTGSYTARKESRHTDTYWYAYRRVEGKLAKRYIGSGGELTLGRLERIAETLTTASSGEDVGPSLKEGMASHHSTFVPSGAPGEPVSPATTPLPNELLLTTKLHVPRPRSRLVSRSHLISRLLQGRECALTLVSAPAGFGKTTLLTQWLAESRLPAAWLSLEPGDNDPVRFFTYLITALQTIDTNLGMTALQLLHTPQPPPAEIVVTLLTNDLMRSTGADFALVLDDYHVITAESIHRALSFLLDHLPPQMHLVLATRADPPLPLSRLRARGHLLELRTAELQLSTSETKTFLQGVMGLDLAPEAIAAIERRTEGWVVGLQLVALSLRGRADIPTFLSGFTGSHRFILDYLSEEVLSQQPEPVLSFLLKTSALERLSGPLCDTVTEQEGSQTMLEALDRANLFVVSLDEERHWYRYHHLFAELLKGRLEQTQPELFPELHRRASIWYGDHGFVVEAVQHALAAQDFERATGLIEQFALSLGLGEHLYTVLGWLKTLPDELIRARPFLCIYYAAILLSFNEVETAEFRLQDAERCVTQGVPAELARIILGYVYSLRSTMLLLSGDLAGGVSIARRSLDLLPETEVIARTGTLVTVAHAFLRSGDVTPAIEHEVEAAVALVQTSGNLQAFVRGISLLAWLYRVQGRLRDVAATYERVARVVPRPEVVRVLVISNLLYYFGLGNLHYELNDLDEAAHYLTLGIDIIKEMPKVEPFVAVLGYTTFARLQQARAEATEALTSLDAFMRLAHEQHFTNTWVMQASAAQAQIELVQGNLQAALHWADENGLFTDDIDLPYPREREYLTLVRVRIAQGRGNPAGRFLQDALHLLDRLLSAAVATARMGSALEILILQSLALHALGERARALSTLERALTFAEPEGYVRLFVDEGLPMLTLLRLARTYGITPNYNARLLSLFGEQHITDSPPTVPSSNLLVEPLTGREREVLRLLLEGMSNQEIARRLVVSVNTTKKHVFNICGKLGVQSRAQAMVKAKMLNLL